MSLGGATSWERRGFRESSGQSDLCYRLMTSWLWQHGVHALGGERAQQRTMDTSSISVPSEPYLWPSLQQFSVLPVSPWFPCSSHPSASAQSEQVYPHKNLLMDAAPLRGICHCCSLYLTQPLGTRAPMSPPHLASCRCRVLFYISP